MDDATIRARARALYDDLYERSDMDEDHQRWGEDRIADELDAVAAALRAERDRLRVERDAWREGSLVERKLRAHAEAERARLRAVMEVVRDGLVTHRDSTWAASVLAGALAVADVAGGRDG